MRRKKQLKELTIKDNFMFGAVMMDEDNCKGLLERVLQIPIDHVEISKEKSIVYHPEYKGVRLDVYAKDENQTRYNVEMRYRKSRHLESGVVITKARWTWRCYWQERIMRNFRIHM